MKKFLKVFIIVLLVLAVIGTTVYFFFRKIEEKNNNTGSIVAMLDSESKIKYNTDIVAMNDKLINKNNDNRLDLIVATNSNLDEIVYVLISYYVDNNTEINNEEIATKLKQVNESRKLLSSMIAEYSLKIESDYFNWSEGANDFYKQSCAYLIQYAELANLLNKSLDGLNKSADFKFNMFEIYSNVVINSFSTTKSEHNKTIIDNSEDIELINIIFEIDNSYISNGGSQFSSNINSFNEIYNNCDKITFAKNLFENVRDVSSVNQGTNEKIATYYFKQIYGI